jgi:1-acyl-sn-glycerol-3-phosphate acyltransferase
MNLKTLLFFVIMIPIMIIGLILAILVNLADRTGDSFHRMAAWWGRFSARLFGISIEVIGREHCDPGKAYLVVSNHAGMADIPLILGTLPLNIRFVAKEELGRIPIFGWALKTGGYILIRRGQNREALQSLLDASSVLESGRSVHIFPEGTRSENGKLQPFKRGAFIVAKKAGAPVLPVTILGSHLIAAKKSLKINSAKIRIVIGKPQLPSSFKTSEELMEACRRTIAETLGAYGQDQS